ncbi:KIN14B-interacting protein At4g14310 [Vigna radiata var. radiata]|uniref:KIN14B-interacting protein At4g14310 n=1 Tax=Vigna radiata var. radiata TaxID=3916 RepID=A0A1S3V8K8_VIGRR|nr:KIN14B-interacting protein At4g14310 [Vigna radiata var. radiata]
MATRRGSGDDGAAAVRPRPISASRRFPSPSLLKENSNPRRSTSRSNPSSLKTLPRGRSSSPSDLSRASSQKPTRDPTPKLTTQKSKLSTSNAQKLKLSTTTTISQEPNDGSSNNSNAKYPSRLHEKLAFLEGKVKRIASDIKKTKEMLDMNNPDASKVILSDIQDKISGIEKAMVHVVSNKDSEGDTHEEDKKLVQGSILKNEELEARLFPHQKLLRERTVVAESVKDKHCLEKEKVLSPVEDNSVAVEFLAFIDKVNAGEEVKEKGGGNGGFSDPRNGIDTMLTANEKLEEFDDQENKEGAVVEEMDEAFNFRLNEIGNKVACGGWFVAEGEAVLLTHHDGSCSYYDIANCEEKAVYMPPAEVSPNIWRDCWVIRAPGSDGCSGRFVVAASAGNTMDSGFCSWDFYTKEVRALQVDAGTTSSRIALRPLPNNVVQRRNSTSGIVAAEAKQCWYRPCGPLIISTASSQKAVKVFDVRDGEQIMKWDVEKPVLAMDYCSPLQWRNRGKIVVAEAESISLWDVNSLTPQSLFSIPLDGRKVSALHVNNTDAELGGGVRKRMSSSEAEGNEGVFCTSDSINVMDFRQKSGVGLRISKVGVNVQSVFCRGDSVFIGCSNTSSMGKKQSTMLQQFSLRRQGLFTTYPLPESNAHSHHAAISQVWGNSDFAMGVCGQGLFVFDAVKDDALRVLNTDHSSAQSFREVIGPDDMYCPSFDYLGSRALLISRDRPAMWRHLIV